MARLVAGSRARGAIVHAKFIEVGQDGQGKFGAEAVAAKLIGRRGISADIDAALLGFDVELRQRADAERVVGCLLLAFHIQTVFGNDFAILGCGHGVVAHVPTKGLEKRVYKRLADVGFLDSRGEEGLPVRSEILTQLCDFIFALVKYLTHKCSILIPGYRQHSDARRRTHLHQRPSVSWCVMK